MLFLLSFFSALAPLARMWGAPSHASLQNLTCEGASRAHIRTLLGSIGHFCNEMLTLKSTFPNVAFWGNIFWN